MLIPFADWRPDIADLNGSVTADLENVLCADGSYVPFPLLERLSAAIGQEVTGGFRAKSSAGQIQLFAGSTTKLYRFDNAMRAWMDVSKPATVYASSKEERWQFEQYGDRVVAVNANTDPQSFVMGSSTTFVDLAGDPPRARHVAVWGDFLALGGLTDFPARVQWSGLDNPEFWTVGSQNSDYQDFPDGGPVQGMTSANNPLIMQEASIRRAVFVPGSDVVFTFDKLHDKRGTKAKYSLAYRGDFVFFLAEDGFYQIDYSGGIQPIGFEKVNKFFAETARAGDVGDTIGIVDPIHSRVYWAFSANTSAVYDTMLIYDWVLSRWSKARVSVRYMMPAASPGYTLEQLDTVSASLDDLPFSLDSRVWAGGAPALAAFDARNSLAFFTGANAEATLTTQEAGDVSGQITWLADVYPVVDSINAMVSIGSRFRRNEPFVWRPETAQSSNTGISRRRARARFHRIKVRLPAREPWTHAQAVSATTAPAGSR